MIPNRITDRGSAPGRCGDRGARSGLRSRDPHASHRSRHIDEVAPGRCCAVPHPPVVPVATWLPAWSLPSEWRRRAVRRFVDFSEKPAPSGAPKTAPFRLEARARTERRETSPKFGRKGSNSNRLPPRRNWRRQVKMRSHSSRSMGRSTMLRSRTSLIGAAGFSEYRCPG